MPRLISVILVSATALMALSGWTWPTGTRLAPAAPATMEAPDLLPPRIEPVRLCGTNSSRSRRCTLGNRDCIKNGRSAADCYRALTICHACIDVMTACNSDAAVPCSECYARYDRCMEPWVALVSKP